jgi:hypothetical protein
MKICIQPDYETRRVTRQQKAPAETMHSAHVNNIWYVYNVQAQ